MKKVIFKDMLREITRSWARFLSIFAIVMVSVAFFSGIRATAPDMRHTADQYYDQYNMMDIRVLSTLGLTQDDIDAHFRNQGCSDGAARILRGRGQHDQLDRNRVPGAQPAEQLVSVKAPSTGSS